MCSANVNTPLCSFFSDSAKVKSNLLLQPLGVAARLLDPKVAASGSIDPKRVHDFLEPALAGTTPNHEGDT